MKNLFYFLSVLAVFPAFSQNTQPIRNQFTTNNAMNNPSDGWISVWNNAAKKWSNTVNVASSTNLPSYLQTATLTNLAGTGLAAGGTNASAYIGSSGGLGTNITVRGLTNSGTFSNSQAAYFGDIVEINNNTLINGELNITGYPNVADSLDDLVALKARAVTNNPNSWYVWTSTNGGSTNAYFAENRQTATKLFSNDFSGLMQNVANRMGEGAHIYQFGNPAYAARYVLSNTLVLTNAFVWEGSGNPATVIEAAPSFSGAMVQLGSKAGVGIGGIAKMKNLRFQLDQGATNSYGVDIQKVAEVYLDDAEWTGYKFAALNFTTTNYIHWSKASRCWFVNKWNSSQAAIFAGTNLVGDSSIAQNHFIFENCVFGIFGGGNLITVSNFFPNLTVRDSHLRFSSGNSVDAIRIYAGGNFTFEGNEFQEFGNIYPINFADRASATNYNIRLLNNTIKNYSSAGPDYLAYIGTFITNITEAANSGYATEALGLAGDNGTIRSGVNASYLAEGNIPIARFNSGTSASSATYWRGDGTWATPAGGSGGTNFPAVINLLGSTNLGVTGGVRLARTITTNASFAFNLQGTAPDGFTFLLGISNYSSSPINATNFANGSLSSAYSPSVASNVTTVAIPANSIKWMEFIAETNFNLGTVRWNIIREEGKQLELAVAGSILTMHTNIDGSIVTISNTTITATAGGGSADVQFNQGTSLAGTNKFIYDRTNEFLKVENDGGYALYLSNSVAASALKLDNDELRTDSTSISFITANGSTASLNQSTPSFGPSTAFGLESANIVAPWQASWQAHNHVRNALYIYSDSFNSSPLPQTWLRHTNTSIVTNQFWFGITNAVAGQGFKFQSSTAGANGVNSIVLTNGNFIESTSAGSGIISNVSQILYNLSSITVVGANSNQTVRLGMTNAIDMLLSTNMTLTNFSGVAAGVYGRWEVFIKVTNYNGAYVGVNYGNLGLSNPGYGVALLTNANAPMWTLLTNTKTYALTYVIRGTNIQPSISLWE